LTIRYILPFLWMESHFAIVGPMVALLSVCDNFGMVWVTKVKFSHDEDFVKHFQ